MRVGIGHDTHRLEEGRPLILGGQRIEHPRGLVGHSDADVVCHAVADALLGAAGAGRYRRALSRYRPPLEGSRQRPAAGRGRRPGRGRRAGGSVNCDLIIHAQEPKLGPHKPALRANLARLLGVDAGAVNVKAKTGEHVGPIGRAEAIACEADRARRTAVEPNPDYPMPLRIYNTLSQTKEPFQTVHPGKVGMYVCGPTVYSPSHIGHMVGPVIFDTIKRYLVYLGLRGDLGRQHHRCRRQADRPGPERRDDGRRTWPSG